MAIHPAESKLSTWILQRWWHHFSDWFAASWYWIKRCWKPGGNFYIFHTHRKLVLRKPFHYLTTWAAIENPAHVNQESWCFNCRILWALGIFLLGQSTSLFETISYKLQIKQSQNNLPVSYKMEWKIMAFAALLFS